MKRITNATVEDSQQAAITYNLWKHPSSYADMHSIGHPMNETATLVQMRSLEYPSSKEWRPCLRALLITLQGTINARYVM